MTQRTNKALKDQIVDNLKVARTQVDTLIALVNKDENCLAVILHSKKTQKLLKESQYLLAEYHLTVCIPTFSKNRKEFDYVRELMTTVRKSQV